MKKFSDWVKEKGLGEEGEKSHEIVKPGTVEGDNLVKPGTVDKDHLTKVKQEKDSLN